MGAVIGAWRTKDTGLPVNASTTIAGGTYVDGVVQMNDYILSRPDQFVQTITGRLLMYATGREVEADDMPQGAGHRARVGEEQLPLLRHRARGDDVRRVPHAGPAAREGAGHQDHRGLGQLKVPGENTMFLTKKHLSRRTTLKGLGISMGLPLLDAMIPAATALAATAAVPKPRVGFFYIPHGMIMDNTPYGKEVDAWTPSGSGANFTLNKIMKPMEKYKHQLTSIANLENMASAGSVHTLNPATWLSAVRPDGSQPGAHMSTTLDQVIAAKVGQETALPSLELAAETTIQSAACGGGAGACYYSTTLSFRNDHTPLPMEFNPRKVFLQLFGEGDTDVERQLISRQTTSILDLITDRTNALKAQLGTQDQRVMDNYLETVREIEHRLEKAKARDLSKIKLPEAPVGELDNFDQQVGMMFDLVALAYQANLTRVASYIMVAEGTNRTYNFINVPDSFHPLSHHANDRERLRKLTLVQTWHMEQFAKFVDKMANTPDGDGSLLDHSLFSVRLRT
ncbi:MAG: DUF1552 domain-containing protein [Proteobacteria bacterium]|nr:DUF1552 domain-containing protein [Pseudomonadota bacterium]